MKPSHALTETQRLSALEAAVLALQKLDGSPKLIELRENIVLESKDSNYSNIHQGILGALGFSGCSFDTQTLLLTPCGIVDHQEHTDGFKASGDVLAMTVTNPGTTRVLCHKTVKKTGLEEVAERYDLDASSLETWLKRIES